MKEERKKRRGRLRKEKREGGGEAREGRGNAAKIQSITQLTIYLYMHENKCNIKKYPKSNLGLVNYRRR